MARAAKFHEELTYQDWMLTKGVEIAPAELTLDQGQSVWISPLPTSVTPQDVGAPGAEEETQAEDDTSREDSGVGGAGEEAPTDEESATFPSPSNQHSPPEQEPLSAGATGEDNLDVPAPVLSNAEQPLQVDQVAPLPLRRSHRVPKIPMMLSPTFGKTHKWQPIPQKGQGRAVKGTTPVIVEPASLSQAMTSPHKEEWLTAVQTEYDRLVEMRTWELVEPPPGAHLLTSKWIFTLKRNPDGTVERFKARLTVRGFAQKEGIDFEETYANTASKTTVRAFFAMVCQQDLLTTSLDVTTAFLYGEIDKEIYMKQPQGQEDGTNRVCKLKKSLYGLKQAPRIWQEELKSKLEPLGFLPTAIDPSLYRLDLPNGDAVWLLDWVDDMVVAGKEQALLDWTYEQLQNDFKLTNMGPVERYIGIWIVRDPLKGQLWMHQEPYIADVVSQYAGELPTKAVSIPIPTSFTLPTKEEKAGEDSPTGDKPLTGEETTKFRKLVGTLNYVATATRLDVAYATNQLARSQTSPMQRHLKAALQVVAYLRDTSTLGLHYSKGSGFVLEAFTDANFTTHDPSFRSMTGAVLKVGGAAIAWISRKQDRITTSTCDSESLAAMTTVQYIEHARDLLEELGQLQEWSTNLYCDNTATVSLCHDPVAHKKSVQLTRPMAYVREKTSWGVVNPLHVRTTDQAADFLTKALPAPSFQTCRDLVGLHPVPKKM